MKGDFLIIDFEKELSKIGLDRETYEKACTDVDSKLDGTKDIDWSEIVQKYNIQCAADTLRKSSTFPFGGRFRSEYLKTYKLSKSLDEHEYFKELDVKRRELEREKIRYRDERRAWNKQNYIDARVEQKLDKLEDDLLSIGKVNFEVNENKVNHTSDNDILVILSDLHIGSCFSSHFGHYDSTVAKESLNQLLTEIVKLQKLHDSENCYISLQGDLINGSIHKTIQVENRENVIDQIKLATEMIASFSHALTKYFNNVYFSNVAGNHTRLDRKDEALHDERLDNIIGWAVGLMLNHIDNFIVLDNNLDTGIARIDIRGKEYVAVHGDFDPFNKNSLNQLCTMLGFLPYAVLYGHLHTCAFAEENGIKMIRGGSLCGTGDAYTIEKRLYSKPSQLVCVCSHYGLMSFNPIYLS